jgi:hypothetical protein
MGTKIMKKILRFAQNDRGTLRMTGNAQNDKGMLRMTGGIQNGPSLG